MRSVLLIAVALLLVAVGLKQEAAHRQALLGPAPTVILPEDQAVRIFSTGWSLTAQEFGQRSIYKSLFVGATEYNKHNELGAGLTVIELPQDGGTAPMRHFNVSDKVEDAVAFSLYLDEVKPLSVLLMGSNTKIGPGTNRPQLYIDQLAGLFLRVDAMSAPTAVAVQSFAHICIKREDGTFHAIAEAFSTTNGVRLAYVIPGDHRSLLAVVPERLLDGRQPVPLLLQDGTAGGFAYVGPKNFGQRSLNAIRAMVIRDENSDGIERASWDLAPETYSQGRSAPRLFTANIATGWSANPKMLGVRFTLRVNDRWVGDRVLLREPGDAAAWRAWEESIPDMEGPVLKVTVEAEWLGDGEGQSEVFLSRPRLIGGHVQRL